MIRSMIGFAPALVGLLACGSSKDDDASGGSDTSGSPTTSAGGDGGNAATGASGPTTNSGNGSSTTSSGTSGAGGDGGGGGGPSGTLRFVALGDGGEGNMTQHKVAQVMKTVCDAKGGCEFALYLGDNIYDTGVSGVDDTQFDTKFEEPYTIVPFRFYVVLGNHDYGGGGAGFEFWKAQAQVDYSQVSAKWTMPDRYYAFHVPADVGPADAPTVDFLGLDTNNVMWTGDSAQQVWLDQELNASNARWKIGYGHHPYISNGQHGNAGTYEGIPFIPVTSGANVKDFMDDSVCNKLDVYISGHDHNRQWLEPKCGTEFIVSGTAAKTTDLVGRGTPTFYENDALGGFMLVEMTTTTFTGTFYDENGTLEYTRTVTKP